MEDRYFGSLSYFVFPNDERIEYLSFLIWWYGNVRFTIIIIIYGTFTVKIICVCSFSRLSHAYFEMTFLLIYT